MADDFEWSGENVDLLLPQQLATAVYENSVGGIVIRQEGQGDEEDHYVVVRPEYLHRLIEKLKTFLPEGQSA